MSFSITYNETQTFTVTHAKHIAAKVATDLKRIQRFYGHPSDSRINNYEIEIIELLKKGYLESVTYGFLRNGNFIEPTVKYTAKDLTETNAVDDDPGKIRPGADINDASFHTFLTYSRTWFLLSKDEREKFENTLPFKRSNADEPSMNGYLNPDRIYSSGGKALNRSSLINY